MAFGYGLFVSLNNLYFNPAYFRDDYRGIAQYLARVYRPGDAVIVIAPNQVEAFGHYHTGGAEVFPLPHARPPDPAETIAALEAITASHPRLFVLYWGDEQADPAHTVETWLNTYAFKAGDTWYGQVRLATYASACPLMGQPRRWTPDLVTTSGWSAIAWLRSKSRPATCTAHPVLADQQQAGAAV